MIKQVQYLDTEGHLIHNLTVRNTISFTDLKPHRNYTFTVTVRSGTESSVLRRSIPVSAIFQTRESIPGKVNDQIMEMEQVSSVGSNANPNPIVL